MKKLTRKLTKLLVGNSGPSRRKSASSIGSTPFVVSREPSIDAREPAPRASVGSLADESVIIKPPPRQPLIPGLPDDLALQCLVRCRRDMFSAMANVCKSWRQTVSSDIFTELRKDLELLEPWLFVVEQRPKDGVCFIRCLDLTSGQWRSSPCVVGSRFMEIPAGCECVVVGHRMILIGGGNQYHSSSNVWCFDSALGRWFRLSPMLTSRMAFACGVAGDCVYVAGGYGADGAALASAEVYDPETDTWEPISNMKVARGSCMGVELRGRFYVIGDMMLGTDTICRQAEIYNPDMDSWLTLETKTWDLNLPASPSFVDIDGPNRPATTILNGSLYAVDETGFPRLLHYDQRMNIWNVLCLLPSPSGDGEKRFAMASYGEDLYIIGRRRIFPESTRKAVELCSPNSADIRSSWRAPREFAYGNILHEIRACAIIEL